MPEDGAAIKGLLEELAVWSKLIRPHQHLHGFTPAEVWRGIDVYQSPPKSVQDFVAWDGLLRGYYLRR